MAINRKLVFSPAQYQIMVAHVRAQAPLEACGLIGGNKRVAQEVVPTDNKLRSQTRFQIDPQSQLIAFQQFEDKKIDLLAIYHSHPNGPATPSRSDIDEWNYPDCISLIWSQYRHDWSCKGFIMTDKAYQEISIEINQ